MGYFGYKKVGFVLCHVMLVVIFVVTGVLAGCAKDDRKEDTSVHITTPSSVNSVEVGKSITLNAKTGDGTNKIKWTVTSGVGAVVLQNAITDTVTIIGAGVEQETSVVVRAANLVDPTKFATREITVRPLDVDTGDPSAIRAIRITTDNSINSVRSGRTITLNATTEPVRVSKAIRWETITNNQKAILSNQNTDTVTVTGAYVDKATPIIVRAISVDNPSIYTEREIFVDPNESFDSANISAVDIVTDDSINSVKALKSINLKAETIGSDKPSPLVWSVVNGTGVVILSNQASDMVTVSASGTNLQQSQVVVRATSVQDPTKFAERTITIQPSNDSATQGVDSVAITSDPSQNVVKVGQVISLNATTYPLNASKSITWTASSGAEAVELVNLTNMNVTVLGMGTVTQASTVVLRASSTQDPAKYVERTIIVEPAGEFVRITTDPSINSVQSGKSISLTATVEPADASKSISWSLVRGAGEVSLTNQTSTSVNIVAKTGITQLSTAVIRAAIEGDLTKYAERTISIIPQDNGGNAPVVQSVDITTNASVNSVVQGNTITLTASTSPYNAPQAVQWSVVSGFAAVSLSNIASNTVTITGNSVTQDSTATVRATAVDDNSKYAERTITVHPSGNGGDGNGETPSKLPVPTNVRLEGEIVKWNAVPNAPSYEVSVIAGGTLYVAYSTQYDLSNLSSGTYSVQVRAMGNYWDWDTSDWSASIPYVVNKGNNVTIMGDGSKVIFGAPALPLGREVTIPQDTWKPHTGTSAASASARLKKFLNKSDYEEIFSNRYGCGEWTPLHPHMPKFDYYSYDNLVKAVEKMANIVVIVEYRQEQTWNGQMFVLHKDNNSTNKAVRVREDEFFNTQEPWVQDKPIIREVIDFGDFLNYPNENDSKREIAAMLGIITQETSEGSISDIPSRLVWGLYWNEEIGYISGQYTGYRDEHHVAYPPSPGKSYHGRGAIQLSWNYNYGLTSDIFYQDPKILLDKPELIVEDGVLGWMTVIAFWMTPQMPKSSCHQVLDSNFKFPNAADASKFQLGFGLVIIIVNGGMESGLAEGTLVQGPNGMIVQNGDGRVWTRINQYRRLCERNGANIVGEKLDTVGMGSWS